MLLADGGDNPFQRGHRVFRQLESPANHFGNFIRVASGFIEVEGRNFVSGFNPVSPFDMEFNAGSIVQGVVF